MVTGCVYFPSVLSEEDSSGRRLQKGLFVCMHSGNPILPLSFDLC